MITHYLWKEKPKIVLPQQQQYKQHHPPVWQRPRVPKINSQAELDAYWAQRPLPTIPTFIKWGSGRELNFSTDLAAVGVIIGVCTNFAALDHSYAGEPFTICMFNCSQYAQLAARWDILDDWMPITQQEYDLLVKPNYDHISAKIKHWTEHEQDRLARSSAAPVRSDDGRGQAGGVPQDLEGEQIQGGDPRSA